MPTNTASTRATDDAQALAQSFFQILPGFMRIAIRAAQDAGLGSPERTRLLLILRDGPLRSGVLAQRCKLSAPSVTELVEALVDEDLARREPDLEDRRAVVISLTSEGRRQLQRFERAVGAELADALAD